jgi:hypothetical protein
MWLALIKLIGGPVVAGLIDAYKAKLAADNTSEKTAADLAANEIAAQTAQANLNAQLKTAEIGHAYEPEKLAFYVTLVFYAKCVLWDKVLALGTTDPLAGDVSTWAGMIMGFYFGQRTFQNVARILKR